MLAAPGIGSGLDINGIVSQLMELERRPVVALEKRKFETQTQISAYGQLKGALAAFQDAARKLADADAFGNFKATSSDASVLGVSAGDTAVPGSYSVQVNRVARQHKMGSAEFLATDTFGGAAGDSLTLQLGSDADNSITLDLSTAKSLEAVRSAINEDPDNPGISATIINGNDGRRRLVLTSAQSGAAGAITASYGGSIEATAFGFQTLNEGGDDLSLLDAEVVVDGYVVNRSDNRIDDIIEGVTLELKAADAGREIRISVAEEMDSTIGAVERFVEAYNQIRGEIRGLRDSDLNGDGTLLLIENRLLGVMNSSSLEGSFRHLSEVGISLQKDGVMTLDKGRLNEALEQDMEGVAQLFSNEGSGYAGRFDSLVDSWLEEDGLIDSKTDGLNRSIDRLQNQQEAMERRLEQVQARYFREFNAMDSLVTQLNGMGAYLAQQLAAMPGAQQ
jgi:flagellar hook-associated protein 2